MTALPMAETSSLQRYELAPQMRVYDQHLEVLAPYLTFIGRPRHRSRVSNTDARGFRWSHSPSGTLDSFTWWDAPSPKGIVLGGSFTYGVGATSDATTLVSRLNSLTGWHFLNLGIRGGNSTQELIAAVPFVESCDAIVVCSGINNLVVNIQSDGGNELYGPFYGERAYAALSQHFVQDLAARVENQLDRVGFSRLAAECVRRAARRFRRASRSSPSPQGRSDAAAHVARAYQLQTRDLRLIANAARPSARVIFVAQPFAETCPRATTAEEARLFDLTDTMQSDSWEFVKSTLKETYRGHAGRLREWCTERGVRFVDCSEMPFAGWSFVDRVHMTDVGYEQVASRLAQELQ